MSRGVPWSVEEDQVLLDNYVQKGFDGTAKLFPHRTKKAVQVHAYAIGCMKRFSHSPWSENEVKILLDHFETKGGKYVAKLLNRKENSVFGKAHDIGLKRPIMPNNGENNYQYKGYKGISGSHWHRIKRNAKRRGFGVGISIEYCWGLFEKQKAKCALTGMNICFSSRVKNYDGTASLDRIDSSKGYVLDNVQWVHKDINKMKWDTSDEDFIKNCEAVIAYRNK